MRCDQCGHENTGNPRFCRECGTPLVCRCPKCGAAEPGEAKFCGTCGAALAEVPAAEAAPALAPDVEFPTSPTERRNASVVFADISRYSTWAATTEASDIFLFVSEWYKLVAGLAEKYEGHFSRAEGDCAMVILGAPTACEDHPERACRLALEIRETFADFARANAATFGADEHMTVHVGVNTGPVAAGRMALGTGDVFDILGHTVNQAQRLLTQAGPGQVYVGEQTHARAERFFVWQEPVALSLRGLPGSVRAYELVGTRSERAGLADSGSPFVGRELELAELRAAAASARGGAGRVIGIRGEAGIGKSRLLHAFADTLGADGFRVALGHCFPDQRAIPYHALAQCLRGAMGLDPNSSPEAVGAAVERLLSGLGPEAPGDALRLMRVVGAGQPADSLDAPEDRQRMTQRAVRRLLLALASAAPLAVIVEDLQWIDAASLALLDHVVPWVSASRVLLVYTFRPGSAPRWGDATHSDTLTLRPLSSAESVALAGAILGSNGAALASEIAERAGGNPLFVQELARAGGATDKAAIPATVQDVIMARMDRLSEDERWLLSVASVVGPQFRAGLLALALQCTPEDASRLLEGLVQAGWVRPGLVDAGDTHTFHHILSHEVAYSRLSRRDRAAVHRRVAEAIESDPAFAPVDRAEILAHHYIQSDASARAAPYLLESIRRAEARDAHESVLLYGERLLDLVGANPDVTDRHALESGALAASAYACAVTGRTQQAIRLQARQRQLAEATGDQGELATVCFAAGTTLLAVADAEGAIREMQRALAIWEGKGDRGLVANARLGLGVARARQGEYEAAREDFRGCFDAPGVPDGLRAAGHLNYGEVCTYLGRAREALEHFDVADRLNARAQDKRLQANTFGGRAQALLSMGAVEQAQAHLETALGLAVETGDVLLQAEILIDTAQCLRRAGDHDQAVASALQGIELASEAEAPNLMALGRASLARTHLAMGDAGSARSLAEQALAEARTINDGPSIHLASRVLADIAGREGRLASALDLWLEALSLAMKLGRKRDEAADLVDVGWCYCQLGRVGEALPSLTRALELARGMDAHHLIALAALKLANAHLDAGSPELACEPAQEGIQAALFASDDLTWRSHLACAQAFDRTGNGVAAAAHYMEMACRLAASLEGSKTARDDPEALRALEAAEAFEQAHAGPPGLAQALERLHRLMGPAATPAPE